MPWSPAEFRERHNKGLSDEQAAHAARIANAILNRGAPEGTAIAVANRDVERHANGGAAGFASGGMPGFSVGHLAIPHFSGGPHVLHRQTHASGPFNRPGFEIGGSPMGIAGSAAEPWWTRSDARGEEMVHPGGLVASMSGGRADHVPVAVASDSFILPADVVAGIGSGNSLNGSAVISKMLSTMPYGIPEPRFHGRSTMPRPPRPESGAYAEGGLPGFAAGRVPHGNGTVKVRLSGGEFVVTPAQVAAIGHGDIERGHNILDKYIVTMRKKIIAKMKALPGPKRD